MGFITEERRRISRQNGQRSRGPKTIAGKIKSSANAITHGLAGQRLSLFGGDKIALWDKLEYWTEFYKPSGPQERASIERAALASSQECRCIVAAHLHVRELVDPAEAAAAILGCQHPGEAGANMRGDVKRDHVLVLYRRYQRDHQKVFHSECSALLESRAEAVTTAPEPGITEATEFSGAAEGGSSPFGYY